MTAAVRKRCFTPLRCGYRRNRSHTQGEYMIHRSECIGKWIGWNTLLRSPASMSPCSLQTVCAVSGSLKAFGNVSVITLCRKSTPWHVATNTTTLHLGVLSKHSLIVPAHTVVFPLCLSSFFKARDTTVCFASFLPRFYRFVR